MKRIKTPKVKTTVKAGALTSTRLKLAPLYGIGLPTKIRALYGVSV